MVSQVWIDAVAGYAQMWGINPAFMVVIVGFVFAIGLAIGIHIRFGAKHDDPKIGTAFFFVIFAFECLIGLNEWIIFIVMLLLFGIYEYQAGDRELCTIQYLQVFFLFRFL
jgi:hypothetical protein